jgi:alpha-tubulin suppressor-like RCC1 family protein
LVPVAVPGLSGVVAITTGGGYSCAVLSSGAERCWGSGTLGQSGNGATSSRSTPAPVSGISTGARIDGGGNHTCTLLGNGTARCWGYNSSGQLGDGTFTSRSTPVQVMNFP